MAWWIQERYVESNGLLRCLVLADTENDLPTPIQQDYTICYGSEGIAIDTGAKYYLNGVGSWVEQPDDNAWVNVYTKTEMDAIIQSVIDGQLTRGDIFRGYQIAANTDVNTLTDYGCYYCSDGTTAATLSNCPITTTGFIMLNFSTGNRVRLFLAVSATTPRMYIQARTGNIWRTIRQFAMADEIPSSVPISLLSQTWENGTATDATGNFDAPSTVRIRSQYYFNIPDNVTAFQVTANYQSGLSVGRLRYAPYFYDANQTYLGDIEGTGWYGWTDSEIYRKIPTNAKFVRLVLRYADGTSISPSNLIAGNISFT